MIMQASGLSKFLGEVLTVFAPLPMWVIALLIAVLVSFLTEITSNSAVVNIVTPVIIAMVSRTVVNNDLNLNVKDLIREGQGQGLDP